MKTPDWNDLKLGTVVVLDSLLKPVDFGFKRSRVRVRLWLGLLPAVKNYVGMWQMSQNIIPCEKFAPTYIMCYQMKT